MCKFARDGKAKNLPDGLVSSLGDIAGSSRLDPKHDVSNVACLDAVHRKMPDGGEHLCFKTL